MGLVTLILWLVVLAVTGISLFLYYVNWKQAKYCKSKGIPYLGAGIDRLSRFLSGSITIPQVEMLLYSEAVRTGKKIVGFNDSFAAIGLYITDLDIARNIYVKDFDHFVNRRWFNTQNSNQILTKMMFGLEGDHWKGIRSKLSPTFTTGKIRRMFNIFDKSSQSMCNYIRKAIGPNGADFDICESNSKYAMDVIASCAFGIDSKSFEGKPGVMSEFEEMAQGLQFRFKPLVFLKFIFILAAPKLAEALGLQVLDPAPQKYFTRVIKEVMQRRRESGERQNDFLQLMMDAQEGLLKDEERSKETLDVMTGTDDATSGSTKNVFGGQSSSSASISFDDDDIVANCVSFLIGGSDTTQSLLIYAAYSLAVEQVVQQKLFEEVDKTYENNGGKLTYDGLLEMKYLDMFINETLRYFPPALRTERACTREYRVPGTDVVIDKGKLIVLPILPIHRDPKYYDNPHIFDPERFLPEKKSDRHPYAFAPFGHGPRNCIGMRFALTEVKAVIATLVHNFKLEPCSRTDVPPQFGNSSTLKPVNGMWLNIVPRSEE